MPGPTYTFVRNVRNCCAAWRAFKTWESESVALWRKGFGSRTRIRIVSCVSGVSISICGLSEIFITRKGEARRWEEMEITLVAISGVFVNFGKD